MEERVGQTGYLRPQKEEQTSIFAVFGRVSRHQRFRLCLLFWATFLFHLWFLLSANPSYEEEFMTNHLFAPPQFAILIDDDDGRRITGTASMHDLEQMRVLAQSILRLMPEARRCDLHPYTYREHYQAQPQEAISGESTTEVSYEGT